MDRRAFLELLAASPLASAARDVERLRVHLLGYGGRMIEGLRVRLRGAWTPGEAHVLGSGRLAVEALMVEDGLPSSRCRRSDPTPSWTSPARAERGHGPFAASLPHSTTSSTSSIRACSGATSPPSGSTATSFSDS